MGVIVFLLVVITIVLAILYFVQFYALLDGKRENIIRDGLVKELINKATADPNPTSFLIDTDKGTINMGRILIRTNYSEYFWFPYRVEKLPAEYHKRVTEDDWGGEIGYVQRYSKDYQHIKALLKKDKVNVERTQRQKLGI
jgi:hypothetical protein